MYFITFDGSETVAQPRTERKGRLFAKSFVLEQPWASVEVALGGTVTFTVKSQYWFHQALL